jgi:hypothetical protein
MDGQWLKITRNLFDSSCDTIRTRILKNMDTVNLNELSVQLHRLGGQVSSASCQNGMALMQILN